MPQPHSLTRREALRRAALGALALPLLNSSSFAAEKSAAPAAAPAGDGREHGLRLGIASYSTRMMTLDESIAVVKSLRISNIALFKNHCNWETASVEECRAVGEKLKAAGLTLTGSGVVNLPNDEAKVRKAFENVRAAGMATMVCKPEPAALPLVEKFVKEFDQKLAIHNHGPEDKVFPSPDHIWKEIERFDARIGFCIDVGHTARSGADPSAVFRKYAARLYDIHMKDTQAIVGATRDIAVEIGTGRLDIRGMLRTLRDLKYAGVVSFEYEKPTGNPVTGLAESLGYVRGMLAGMA
ncbi:MAG: sugar phosphate isomerase/epimerase [Verrucomicrobia bacterium]|nr:sugar phosphate isomerase/epimerase [Verrucomicrobiota bacterium]